jgi:hypothetical protein
MVGYERNAVFVERRIALPWQSLPTVQDALGTADYILVTNPTRLHDLYASIEVHDLLGTMAHLARIRNGALGFLDTYVGTYANSSSEDILQTLTRPGGYWAESLHPDFQVMLAGYMLIVGETEIVPAWDTHDYDLGWDAADDVFHHDQWYSSTGGDGRPELVVGRAIGDSASQLANPLQTSIAIHEGLPGSYYEVPGNALLVSGRGPGVNNFEWHVQVVGKILDDGSGTDDWEVDILNLPDTNPDVALQNGLANGISLLHLRGHGNIDSWGGGGGASSALVTINPPSLYNYHPFIFAVACLTGDYEKGDDYNLAESLFDQGVAAYIGATQVSPREQNGEISTRFYGDHWEWTNGETLGRAFSQAERYWYNEWAWYDWYHFWVVEYNFYGDPKFGAAGPPPLVMTAPGPATAPTTTLHVEVPDYVITTTVDGFDRLDIPGGPVILEGGLHRVPYWSFSLDYAPGYRVQDVELTLRSGRALTTGLILSTTVVTYNISTLSSGGPTQTPFQIEDDDWFPALDDIYVWQVSDHPDGSSELTIQIFPFHYQPATTNAEWYGSFDFAIDVITTSVDVEALQLDGSCFVPGDPVGADLWLDNGAAPGDLIVAPTVRDLASGDTVTGLELHALHGLTGPATYSFEWDSSGFAPGQYQLWVDIFDSEGHWLDSASQMFRLGISAVEISTFDATPDFFHPGDPINISMVVHNTGSMSISGEAIIQVQTASGLTTTAAFTHPLTDLVPGAEIGFDDVWYTSGETETDYRVLGYVKYNSRASEVETVHLTTRPRIYLPLIQRVGP